MYGLKIKKLNFVKIINIFITLKNNCSIEKKHGRISSKTRRIISF